MSPMGHHNLLQKISVEKKLKVFRETTHNLFCEHCRHLLVVIVIMQIFHLFLKISTIRFQYHSMQLTQISRHIEI